MTILYVLGLSLFGLVWIYIAARFITRGVIKTIKTVDQERTQNNAEKERN